MRRHDTFGLTSFGGSVRDYERLLESIENLKQVAFEIGAMAAELELAVIASARGRATRAVAPAWQEVLTGSVEYMPPGSVTGQLPEQLE